MKRNKSNGESKKHKSFEKFKALFSDKRSYLRRLAIAAPVWLAVCFTFLFFGPFELVAYSGKSLFYSYKDVGPILAVAAAAVFAVSAPLIPLIRGKIFNYTVTVILSATVCAYLQAMFFNGELGALTGDPVDWLQYRTELLLYELLQIGERRKASLQNTVHVRDSRSVVGKGNAGVCGAFCSVGNLALTEHTASAVDHKVIFFKAFGDLTAGGKLEAQAFDSRMSATP